MLGNAKGAAKPIPFVEDTCVPPEFLADYIAEFRALLDRHNLQYGMFGHVDAGVLHVRPALDLCDRNQVKLFKQISDQVAELTHKYGGLLWGEHGKGMRSHYGEKFFTAELWRELRYIKFLFDPENRLNAGKICTPLDSEDQLYSILSPMRADNDRQIPVQIRDEFNGAMTCNGNGLCFNFDVHSIMCPSLKVSRNRVFSPKGRAAMVREWLRLLANENVSHEQLDFRQSKIKLVDLISKIRHSVQKMRGEYDFSHEVKAAMDTCLACKACASQCPIKIDVPSFRAKFFHFYHQRYIRPIKDHVVSNVEFVAPLMAKAPQFFNFFTTAKVTQPVARKVLGMVDLPALTVPNLHQQLVQIGYKTDRTLAQLAHLTEQEKAKTLLIVQDPFTSYYDAKVVADFVELTQKLGYQPIVIPFKPNGKAQHIKGFLQRFAKTAKNQADYLNSLAKLDLPLVGVDPAIVLSYREEYREILGEERGDFHVITAHEWLKSQLNCTILKTTLEKLIESAVQNDKNFASNIWYLFPHCTESTSMPNSPKEWQQIFAAFGQKLQVENVGCCGMAGTFGHETVHLAMSKEIYNASWAVKIASKNPEFCLATGYSCRSQVKRIAHWQAKHPVQALLGLFK